MLQPPPASLTWSNPLNNNPLHVFNRLIEKYLIAQRRACHRLHLRGMKPHPVHATKPM